MRRNQRNFSDMTYLYVGVTIYVRISTVKRFVHSDTSLYLSLIHIYCDAPQHSIHGLRERETGLIGGSLYFKALACDHFCKIDVYKRQGDGASGL